MTKRLMRIATRKSPLALWQANFVKEALEAFHSGLVVELVPLTTRGDKILEAPLANNIPLEVIFAEIDKKL